MFSKYEGIADITLLSRNVLGKSIDSIPLLMNGILMKYLMWLIQNQCKDEEHVEYNIHLVRRAASYKLCFLS